MNCNAHGQHIQPLPAVPFRPYPTAPGQADERAGQMVARSAPIPDPIMILTIIAAATVIAVGTRPNARPVTLIRWSGCHDDPGLKGNGSIIRTPQMTAIRMPVIALCHGAAWAQIIDRFINHRQASWAMPRYWTRLRKFPIHSIPG